MNSPHLRRTRGRNGTRGRGRRSLTGVLITPRGGIPGSYATKILWHVRSASATVTLVGQRLDGIGRFRQRFPVTGGSGYFPSIVIVPSVGCWRITVSSRQRTGRFAFLALAP